MLIVWILLTLVALLAIPVELSFNLWFQNAASGGHGQVRWLFGWVKASLPGSSADQKKRSQRPKPRRQPSKRASPLAALSVEGSVRHILAFIKRMLRAIHIVRLSADGRLGLGDPADTGRLWALLGPLSGLLAIQNVADVRFQPDFDDQIVNVAGDGCLRVVPLELVWVVMGFLLSPTTWRLFRAMRRPA